LTKLSYRNCPYFKEVENENFRQWWNLVHGVTVRLKYRGISYRPIRVGGLVY